MSAVPFSSADDPSDADAAEDAAEGLAGDDVTLILGPDRIGQRLDRALADAAAEQASERALSRSRIRALVEAGHAAMGGATLRDPSVKVKADGVVVLTVPAPRSATPQAEPIPIDVVYEDAHLIVVMKPAGMAAHPAPGTPSGTLVNALLAHCGDTLSGVGGEVRPGIVHRLDKDTSGLMVVAKTDAAHQGLAAAFATHDIERRYRAICWSVPDGADPRIAGLPGVSREGARLRVETGIARHRSDRKRMAATRLDSPGSRRAVTFFEIIERFGPPGAPPLAAEIACTLETGRTHQIRVHAASLGCGLLGDPVYGRERASGAARLSPEAREALTALDRQALHAELLGFVHPIEARAMRFERPPPEDFMALAETLREQFR